MKLFFICILVFSFNTFAMDGTMSGHHGENSKSLADKDGTNRCGDANDNGIKDCEEGKTPGNVDGTVNPNDPSGVVKQ